MAIQSVKNSDSRHYKASPMPNTLKTGRHLLLFLTKKNKEYQQVYSMSHHTLSPLRKRSQKPPLNRGKRSFCVFFHTHKLTHCVAKERHFKAQEISFEAGGVHSGMEGSENGIPRCSYACRVATRPRGVLCKKPSMSR